jgi:hypothetical protein
VLLLASANKVMAALQSKLRLFGFLLRDLLT